jgi:hypothetical protein
MSAPADSALMTATLDSLLFSGDEDQRDPDEMQNTLAD